MNVGPYLISGELGRGAAGVVFSGHAPDGREVAIKLLHRATPEGRARFERERRLLTGFGEAEGFVPLLDAGDSAQGPWLAMPLVSGGTLRTRLSRGGALPIDEAVELVRALGEAMGRAHAQGVVHRDLKPENVLFTAEGRALIADLGLAKHFRRDVGGAGSVSLSKTGELRGTAGYMAPEQVDSAKSVGPPADVFALGSLLHECLTGRSPFPGETVIEVVRAALDGDAEPPSRLRPEVPRWLDAVVARCLAPAADARFADGAALAAALEAGEVAPPASRRGIVAAGVGLLVLVVAAAGALAARPLAEAPSSVAPVFSSEAATGVRRLPARDDLGVASTQDWARAVAVLGTSTWTHAGAVEAIALTPDGERVVSGGEDLVLRVWRVADGRLERELAGLTASPRALAISPDGRLVAAGAADGTVAVWDLARGVLLQSSRERDGPVTALTFSPDGALVMSGGSDGRFGVGRFDEPSRAQIDCSAKPLTALAFTKDGARFATGDAEGVVLVYEVPAWERARRVGGVAMGGGAVRAIAFVEDDPRNIEVVSVDASGMVRSTKGAALTMSALGGDAWKVALSADAARVVLAGQTDVRVFQRAGDRLLRALCPPGTVLQPVVALSADGSRVAVGAQGQCSVAVFDVTTGAPLPASRGHAASVRAVARGRASGGDAVVSLDALGGVVRWEAGAPRRVAALDGTLALAVAADGRLAVTTHAGAAAVWDAGASSSRALEIPPAAGALAFTPRGDWLLVATRDGPVRVVDPATGASVRVLEGHTTPARALAVDPAGERAVSGAGDATARVWRLSNGQEVHRLQHPLFVSAVAVSRDLVLTCCQDDVVRAWDLDTGARVRELTLDQGPVNTTFEPPALAFTPDGAHALAGGSDGALHVWRVSDWALIDEVRFEQPAGNDRAGFRPFERATSVDVAPDGRAGWLGTSLGRLVRLDLRGGP